MQAELSEYRERLHDADEIEVIDAIIDIGKERIRPLTAEVGPFLKHASPDVRAAAAKTLGFHLRAEQYLDAIRSIAENESDTDARMAGIFAWASLKEGSRDPQVLAVMEGWLRDKEQPWGVRTSALLGLYQVVGIPSRSWPSVSKMKDIDADTDWSFVEGLLGRDGSAAKMDRLAKIPLQIRQQLESGSVWQGPGDTHPHDGLLRAIRTAGADRSIYSATVLALLSSDDLRHRTGAVGVLFEVARELGAGRVAAVLRANVALHRGVRPAWPIGEPTLEQAAILAVAPHAKADGSGAIEWLRGLVPLIAAESEKDQPWISAVLVALAKVDTEWFLRNTQGVTTHAQIELIKALPVGSRAAYIRRMAPWPPEIPDSLTRFFWKGFPPEESSRLRALMWPEAS